MLIYKIRHRWGIWLGKFQSSLPQVTQWLRLRGLPVNGYMPKLPKAVVAASLLKLSVPTLTISSGGPTIADLISQQPEPTLDFDGNIRPIRISRIRRGGLEIVSPKLNLISDIWPGDAYSFESEEAYLSHYSSNYYAFSPKKGGWDTMRSVEIMSTGCIPIIPRIDRTPELALYGYPKEFLRLLWEQVQNGYVPIPTQEDQDWIISWAQERLTAEAQAKFVLSQSGFKIQEDGNVLYLDLNLKNWVDYVCIGNLVGLYRVLGQKRLSYVAMPKYLTADKKSLNSGLYGKGFGYSSELSMENLTDTPPLALEEFWEIALDILASKKFKLVIVGGLEYFDPTPELRYELLTKIASMSESFASIYGGDFPVSNFEMSRISQLGMMFVREFKF